MLFTISGLDSAARRRPHTELGHQLSAEMPPLAQVSGHQLHTSKVLSDRNCTCSIWVEQQDTI